MESSSSPPSPRDYQVFLNFRGEDTRKTFISHLYKALNQWGIRTFKDDKDLDKGKSISPELIAAIQQSEVAIVVFSPNYAFSSWCLDELVEIFECTKTRGQWIIPVFYDVNSSHVGKQKGRFEEAFMKHKESFEEDKIRRWKEVLTKVASISGWDWRNWNDESEFIEEIVSQVSAKVSPGSSSDTRYIVGIDAHMKRLDHWLWEEPESVRMIGLWGMGGVGKSTIARYFYDRFCKNFDHCCFLDNVKELFGKHGTLEIQEKFLSEIFREKTLKLWDEGTNVIKDRLHRKKVLVVLDDVDDLDQLFILAGETKWFGVGSRIIITTRDKKLLQDHNVQDVCKIEPLGHNDSLQVFSNYAFGQHNPKDDFLKLSSRVVECTAGLPLALKVLGSMLRNRTKSEWEDALNKLSETSNKNILETLKLSYNGLEDEEKNLFLYIACVGSVMYFCLVREILDSGGFHTYSGIKILVEKSLITFNGINVWVHDLLRDMARDINRQDGPAEPWRYRIVWDNKDIDYLFTVSNQCNENFKVEGLFANVYEAMELHLSPKAFKQMYNLKFLKIWNNYNAGATKVRLPDGLDCLPRKLTYLYWDGFPLKSLPPGFCPQNLVILELYNSSLERLWIGAQPLRSLKRMVLKDCLKLTEFPDLSKAANLEWLEIEGSENLVEVSASIANLDNLKYLSLSYCSRLKEFPDGINLKSLNYLYLRQCSSLHKFPLISKNVLKMYLNATGIAEVPTSIKNLSRLKVLDMTGCEMLKNLPTEIRDLDSLEWLFLSDCHNITKFPEIGRNMRWLYLRATAIEGVPSWIENRPRLVELNMSYCKRLGNLPDTIQSLTSLRLLNLRGCPNITKFRDVPRI